MKYLIYWFLCFAALGAQGAGSPCLKIWDEFEVRKPAHAPDIVVRELSSADKRLFEKFYHGLYTAQFPDADERESAANMANYLRKKEAGWYRANNYHIVLALDQRDHQRVVGAVVSDYFARPNSGVIEFITTGPQVRRQGLGLALHDATLRRFARDAQNAAHSQVAHSFAEMNDPAKTDPAHDNMDPAARATLWSQNFGYKLLKFSYVQPALSSAQKPVENLCLLMKPIARPEAVTVCAGTVSDLVWHYMVWAMRISDPEKNAQFKRMRNELLRLRRVELADLAQHARQNLFHRP